MSHDDADRWAQILIDCEDGNPEIAEILDTFRFVSCVAYRHN